MPEDYYTARAVKSGSSLKGLMLAAFLSFAGGAALVGYLVWNGQIELGSAAPAAGPTPLPSPSPAPSQTAASSSALDQQIAALEQRVARLNLQAAAFDGSSARAEGMLVALATRRAIEQGLPLGYLEGQLQLRFGSARPAAVQTIIAAAKDPVTLDMLTGELDELGPELLGRPRDEGMWDRVSRTVSGLFEVKRDDGKARPAERRLDQARLLLRNGRINEAIAEVAQLPGNAAATGWIEKARRYAAAQAALAQIEEAALTEPQLLRSGEGERVAQPGLPASPSPTPSATPAAVPAPKP